MAHPQGGRSSSANRRHKDSRVQRRPRHRHLAVLTVCAAALSGAVVMPETGGAASHGAPSGAVSPRTVRPDVQPPFPKPCTQAQLDADPPASFGGNPNKNQPNCLEDYVINNPGTKSRSMVVSHALKVSAPIGPTALKQPYAHVPYADITMSMALPPCSPGSGECWAETNAVGLGEYLPVPADGSQESPLAGIGFTCPDACPSTSWRAYLFAVTSDPSAFSDRWFIVGAMTTVTSGGQPVYNAYAQTAIELTGSCEASSSLGVGSVTSTASPHAAGNCPLHVWLSVLHPGGAAKSGLTDSLGVPIFTKPTPRGSDGDLAYRETCLSGCTDVLARVTDPHDKQCSSADRFHNECLVPGADVSASRTPMTSRKDPFIAPYPEGTDSPAGKLCLADSYTRCGSGVNSYLTGARTDGNGAVILRYWEPGVIALATTIVTVKAFKHICDARVCADRDGERSMNLDVYPNVVYRGGFEMPASTVQFFAGWARYGPDALTGHEQSERLHVLHELYEKVQTYLKQHASEGGGFSIPGILFEKAAKAIGSRLFWSLVTDWFAGQFTPDTLVLNGLGEGGAELAVTHAHASFIDGLFKAAEGNDKPDEWGLMYRWAYDLSLAGRTSLRQHLGLTVYEVSYCNEVGLHQCGPGWAPRSGIESYLYFQLESNDAKGTSFSATQPGLLTRYDPAEWLPLERMHYKA